MEENAEENFGHDDANVTQNQLLIHNMLPQVLAGSSAVVI